MRAPRSGTLIFRARSAAVAAPSPIAVNRFSSIAARKAGVLWYALMVLKINSGDGCWGCVVVAMGHNNNMETFNEPRLALNRIYTNRGDQGETSLVGGQRLPKDARRIEAYGTVDELNSFVGAACLTVEEMGDNPAMLTMAVILKRVQHELFNLGSILATNPEDVHPKQPTVTNAALLLLEKE